MLWPNRFVRTGAIAALATTAAVALIVLALAPVAPEPRPFTSSPIERRVPVIPVVSLSIDDAASPWVVVNKQRPLAQLDYVPADLVRLDVPSPRQPELRAIAAHAVSLMFAAFTAETGLSLQAISAYRSFESQQSVYAGWTRSLGQSAADLTSARPGFSEHQTGFAVDVDALPATACALQPCWGDTPHAHWIAENAHRFGFVVRYPADKTAITGYEYEPYHLRFVGVDLATSMREAGVTTLEEQFGLPPAPGY